jgi:uncharacterized protein (TIGR03435 family)
MQDLDDLTLLREYAARQSEAAFAELVSRRVGFVYSAALRQVRDPHLAEEITQAVFIILAQKAGKISDKTIFAGWLFKTTRYTAITQTRDRVKHSLRKAAIEKEFQMQTELQSTATDETWNQMSPLLDEALASLGETDRQAVLLRFFENKSLAEVGSRLGTGEDTARKRVTRALEKLHHYFTKRGVNSTTAIIAGAISANSVQAAPVALAKSVTAVALAKGAAASGSTLTLIKGALKIMAWTKAKTAIVVGIAAVLATGTTAIVVNKVVSSNQQTIYESIFKHPDASNYGSLEQAPLGLIVRPTHYPGQGMGFWTMSGKGVFVGATLADLIAWAYDADPIRVILPDDAPKGNFDYLNTLPQPKNALREEIKKQFGLVVRREVRPTDVILLKASNPAKLNSLRTQGGNFACYGTGNGNIQMRYFTNASLSLLAAQDVVGYFQKPCVDRTDPNAKYDFAFQWEEPKGLTGEARRNALRPVIEKQINQLGLELVPSRESIEMLVVEKMK